MLILALALAASIDLPADIAAVAALPGEPHIVSAAAVEDDHRFLTLEDGSPFDASPKRRLVLVGGNDPETAPQVVDAVKWFKTMAPPAVRGGWTVAACPEVRSGRMRLRLYDWVAFQAPDLVVKIGADADDWPDMFSNDAARTAAGLDAWVAPVRRLAYDQAFPQSLTDLLQQQSRLSAASTDTHTLDRPTGIRAGLLARVARDPLAIARVLAARYPQQPIMSYIPSVAWVNMLRLTGITKEREWRDRVVAQTAPWISGDKPLFGGQTPLTSIAGAMIFGEMKDGAKAADLLREPATLAAATKDDGTYANGRGWTDDMFMATAVLVRTGHVDLAARMLVAYGQRLQRSDGLFIHGTDGPFAWGRGNGFAAFGAMEALSVMPVGHPQRAAILQMFRRQMAALVEQQAPDGMWREVVDEPGSYREETATAMIFSAMARGLRVGWLDRSYAAAAARAWRALAAHIADDGSLVDVCESTGAGPTRQYYLDRKALTGFDDRGGAMALMAAIEQHEWTESRAPGRAKRH